MNKEAKQNPESHHPLKPLRVWIAIILLVGMGLLRFIPGMIDDGPAMIWMVAAFGPGMASILLLGWWIALSRAGWIERGLGIFGIIGGLSIAIAIGDPTMRGPGTIVMTFPMGVFAFSLVLIVCSRLLSIRRTWLALTAACVCFGFSTALKSDGMWGDGSIGLDWRWNATPEETFLAQKPNAPTATIHQSKALTSALMNPEWPGFRGPNRDGVQRGSVIDSDWKNHPPVERWRIKVGPGWSSFAVAGPLLFTQEQRGESEAIVCYEANTGHEVWAHATQSRFFDSLGGLGPRATPTVANGHVFALGAEGWLNCLDALTGEMVWQIDLRIVAEVDPPDWGFASSPLVIDGVVIVHSSADGENGINAFDQTTGKPAWTAPAGTMSYCSPQIANVAGRQTVAMLTNEGLHLYDPNTGIRVLNYQWNFEGYRALQPKVVGDDRILIPTGMGMGTRLVRILDIDGELSAKEVWSTPRMKPDFNDLVFHKGFLYGFDNEIFSCIDVDNQGKRKWKKGRYGKGQVLLLADSGLLLITTETGELVLLKADPDKHDELFRVDALKGKTWNHPVIVSDRLYIRNAQEAVCYQLPTLPASIQKFEDASSTNTQTSWRHLIQKQ